MKILKLFIAILICLSAGFIGSYFTMGSIDTWYVELTKPMFNPPSFVFSPVWTILYVLMGVSAFLVWEKGVKRKDVQVALSVFVLQLVLNTTWTLFFFGLQSPLWALINIVLLIFAIIWTMKLFWSISKKSTYLLIPYLLWVSYATYLNAAIRLLN